MSLDDPAGEVHVMGDCTRFTLTRKTQFGCLNRGYRRQAASSASLGTARRFSSSRSDAMGPVTRPAAVVSHR